MTQKIQHILVLLLLYAMLLTGGVILLNHTMIGIEPGFYFVILTMMMLITLGAYLLVMAGFKRKEADRGVFLLAGVGGKFLAYLIMILIFWTMGINPKTEVIITFFVLYLLFTIFLVGVLYKMMKIN